MDIALIAPYDLDVPGGVQGQVVGMAHALRAMELDVTVIAPGQRANDFVGDDGLHTIRVGRAISISANGSRAPISPFAATMRRTQKTLLAFRPDIVHIHEPFVPGPSMAALFGTTVPVIATFHRSGSDRFYRAFGGIARRLVTKIDDLIAVSDAAKATLVEVLRSEKTPISVLSNGVDVERTASVAPWPSLGPTAVFVGRHEHRKGLATLLEAFGQLPPTTMLWVIGTGPETRSLQAQYRADPRIEWCGVLRDEEVAARIAGADVLVAPSHGGESFGVVLLEAMAARTAVLASDIPGYRIAGGDAATFFPERDVQRLAFELQRLLADKNLRDRLVEKGRARAESHSFAALMDAYCERYERVLRARGRP